VDQILRDSFGKPDGLADPSVTVLDPAAGTMTFPATAVRLAAETYKAKYGDGSLDSWIKGHVLRDFYAFELMMAPYAIGHLRMGTLLTELGYTMSSDDRFKLYLTNTLDVSTAEQNPIPGLSPLAEESHMAEAVKTTQPVLVIMGNPPYSSVSTNKGAWITGLINDYKQVDGKPLGEKKQLLGDDYVKFIRFAQWKIDQAGEGVLGFITNHSYLDNPTFRGMRQSLMASFDQVYVLNLHGNSLRRESGPEGGKDENVFDIRAGVAILLAVKRTGLPKCVSYADLWGTRSSKYFSLSGTSVTSTPWLRVEPRTPAYALGPEDVVVADEYHTCTSVTDVFVVRSSGVYTRKDDLCVAFQRQGIWQTVSRLASMNEEDARDYFHLGPDTENWSVVGAQADLRQSGPSEDGVSPILYRPFDTRFTYFTGSSGGWHSRPGGSAMRAMRRDNIGLCVLREASMHGSFSHALVSASLVDNRALLSSRGATYVFPLYDKTENSGDSAKLFSGPRDETTGSNISPVLLDRLREWYGPACIPERVFAYVYAVLYSPAYRARYAEFLKTDFPRIPFTKDRDTFLKLAELGQQLIDLHLMRSPELDNPISRFCGKGDGAVTKVEYDADRGRVTINPTQYFDGVTPDLWSYQIGGYQVLSKWLKDRKGRFLASTDTIHYSRIVTALAGTVTVEGHIDTCTVHMWNLAQP
jgi:predicted helicase